MCNVKSFKKIADEQGWSAEVQVQILLRYVAQQDDADGFENFLLEQVEKEDATDHIGG